MSEIVSTYSLSKRYGDIYAVEDVNLSVSEGDIFGFLGPNGAGKTTTLKMILGLIGPTKGKVKVFGKDFESNRQFILSHTGSLIESPSYYGHLTGLENMRIIQKLRELPDRNMTVLISSHLLSEIEQIATSVGIINNGKMIFQGSMKELKKKKHPKIKIKTRANYWHRNC